MSSSTGEGGPNLVQGDVLVHHAPQRVDDRAVGHCRWRIGIAVHLWSSALKIKHGAALPAIYGDRQLRQFVDEPQQGMPPKVSTAYSVLGARC